MWYISKMAVSNSLFGAAALFLLCIASTPSASWNVTAEGDGRLNYSDTGDAAGGINLASLSIRKTLSDSKGDRLIIFVNGEAENNFKELMLHEAYLRYKGPLSLWNVTLGRFAIPFGTIQSYTSSRYLWAGLENFTVGIEADDGLLISGVTGMFDYAFSVTRGVGTHGTLDELGEGLLSTRFAIPFGMEESFVLGLSGTAGRLMAHHGVEERILGGADAFINLSRLNSRVEAVAGKSGEHTLISAGWIGDFSLTRLFEINSGLRYSSAGEMEIYSAYCGLTAKIKGFTLRGGYTYDYEQKPFHSAALQLYYQYTWVR
ncbi:MAG: hypothetical protein JNL74_07110 [Fibrobacteres bacterium]|nr:hypothetical protein [Fibrobacterota bacterium]